MSFFKNLFTSKPPPDNAVAVYVDELKQMGETLIGLRLGFAQYGRSIQLVSNNALQLAHTIRQFNQGLKLTNPHVQDYAVATIHFRDDINKVWSKQYVDEVLGMFDHWNRNAEAQQSTIANYHIARDHCFTLKVELDELLDRRQGYINQKKIVPHELVGEIAKSQEQYKKYSVALDNIRAAIVANQAKLLGKNGQLLSFSRAFYALLESQCNLTSYFGALTDSYAPLLAEYRKELGITIQDQGANQHHGLGGGPGSISHQIGASAGDNMNNNNNGQFSDDNISVLDIAHFIRQTASLENDSSMISDVNNILNHYSNDDSQQPQSSNNNSDNNNNSNNNQGVQHLGLDVSLTPAANLSIQTDSPQLLSRRTSLQAGMPGSPSQLTSPTTTTDPLTGLPTLSFSLSTRKKRSTMVPTGPMSPGAGSPDGLSPIAGHIHGTAKKASSRAQNNDTPQAHFGSSIIPPFQLDEPNIFHQQLREKESHNNNTSNNNNNNNPETPDIKPKQPDTTIMCAFTSMPLDDDDDDDVEGFFDGVGMGSGDGRNSMNKGRSSINNPGSSFQSILERMVSEETHLVLDGAVGSNGNSGNDGGEGVNLLLSDDEAKKYAQRWSTSNYNASQANRSRIMSLLSTLNALCAKHIADWIVVEIELQLWAKSPSLQLLLCTLNTLTICKQIQQYQGLPGQFQLTTEVTVPHPLSDQPIAQLHPIEYGFTFRSVSPENINQYFQYVYNIFTALLQQLLGNTDDDITNTVNKMVELFGTPGAFNEKNVQILVQAAQLLRLLTVLSDKCLIDLEIKAIQAGRGADNEGEDEDEYEDEDEDEDGEEEDE